MFWNPCPIAQGADTQQSKNRNIRQQTAEQRPTATSNFFPVMFTADYGAEPSVAKRQISSRLRNQSLSPYTLEPCASKSPPGPFSAYLFDCDGTVVDSMPQYAMEW